MCQVTQIFTTLCVSGNHHEITHVMIINTVLHVWNRAKPFSLTWCHFILSENMSLSCLSVSSMRLHENRLCSFFFISCFLRPQTQFMPQGKGGQYAILHQLLPRLSHQMPVSIKSPLSPSSK